ncbi:putative bifunctional diguanylate cyclase/phosphodiesterase [Roseobacter sp. S98]|uniref:putative bifunctional diguanylate cyclase/phosphodiesterase n=1 Tax=Roseobacter algicola (ex Choi et al. 2025) (nom. illeg.) TaxID=3092138 RepID=UPI003F50F7F8
MPGKQKNRFWSEVARDALSSRVGIFLSISLLILLFAGAWVYTQSVAQQIAQAKGLFENRQIRNGYVAISDVQRLILVGQRAAHAGGFSPELEDEFADAADILFVRKDHLKTILNNDVGFASGKASIIALETIVDLADSTIAGNYTDIHTRVDELLIAAGVARKRLVVYLDEMRRHGDEVMAAQSAVVRKQQLTMIGSLAGLTLVGIIALALLRSEVVARRKREEAEERVEFLAFFDALTTLPNRIQFQDRLRQMLNDPKRPFALIFVDLDEFKAINDTYGHAAGDTVLRRTGAVLKRASQVSNGFAARLGGDEFALIVPTDKIDSLLKLCEHIIEVTSEPFDLDGEQLLCRVSIGLATTTQVRETMVLNADTLSRVTDFALYASKARGRACYTVYDSVLERQFLERRAMLEELPTAIQNGDLEVYFQPKVRLPDGEVYGFEALVRWNRNGQVVNPGEFIQLAEESGLVVDIDTYVLNKAARIISEHNEIYGTEYTVSANLSAVHFNSSKILKTVEHLLWRSDIRPELLTLEITETTEMRDWAQANEIIHGLRQKGCRISIDDFGTGFSSLAYLRAMFADELKIDRSLVEEIETSRKARLMLASVLEIARHMELDVVVEGIENTRQARIVHEMGARWAQGYCFGRPVAALSALSQASGKSEDSRNSA